MIYYYIISFFTQVIEAFAGFGATAIGLPFLAMAMDTKDAVALLPLNSFIVNVIVLCFTYKKVAVREWLAISLPILAILPLGLFVFSALSGYDMILKLILGLVIIFVGGRFCYYRFLKKEEPKTLSRPLQYTALAAGAVVQGMFSTGGPLITLYTANRLTDKGSFRATMSAVWATVNAVAITARALLTRPYTPDMLLSVAKGLPVVLAGCALGMLLHKRVPNGAFRDAVYLILFLGGVCATGYSLAGLL